MKKGILIDMGETIVHNYDINYELALHKVYELIDNKKEIIENDFVNHSFKILNSIFKNRSYIEFKMVDYIKLIKDIFNIKFTISLEEVEQLFYLNCCKTTLVENIEQLLKYFKEKNYPIILLSNTSYSKNVIKNALGKLNKYFDDIIVSSDYPIKKPNVDIFNVGIAKINLNKENIFYIGNNYDVDIIGAYNAGINPIWFNENRTKIIKKEDITYLEINNFLDLISTSF